MMEPQERIRLFEEIPVPKAVMTLTVPMILSSLVMVFYSLADTYFVGMLDDPIQNAAVAYAAPVLLAFNAVTNLFGVGSSTLMSRALGRKDYDTIRRGSAFGFYCALLCGLLFSAALTLFRQPMLTVLGVDAESWEVSSAYLNWTVTFGAVPAILNIVMDYLVRAEGNALQASIGSMGGCLLNIALDPIFVLPWGLNLGAAGAGLATCLSNCVACLYYFAFLLVQGKSTYISISPRMFRLDKSIISEVCNVGIPAAIQNLLNVTGMTILNNCTAAFGTAAVSAMGIAQRVNTVPFYVALGFSQGIMPVISYNFGSGNIRRMKETAAFTAKAAISFMVIVSAVYFFGAEVLIGLFMKHESVVAHGSQLLKCLCLCLPFECADFLAVGVFQACGMGRKALLFAVLRKIVLELPALFLWNHIWPLYGLAMAQPTAEIILSVAAVAVTCKLFRRLETQPPTLRR